MNIRTRIFALKRGFQFVFAWLLTPVFWLAGVYVVKKPFKLAQKNIDFGANEKTPEFVTSIVFKTGLDQPYDLFGDPEKKRLMIEKIRKGMIRYKADMEAYYEALMLQTMTYKEKANVLVQAWYVNREQCRFVEAILRGEIIMPETPPPVEGAQFKDETLA